MTDGSRNKESPRSQISAAKPENTQRGIFGKFGQLIQFRLLTPLLAIGLILIALSVIEISYPSLAHEETSIVRLLFSLSALVLLIASVWVLWHDLLKPLLNLKDWTLLMRGGDLSARMPLPYNGELLEVIQDLNMIGEMLNSQSRNTEQQLSRHTDHITQKTRSLKILYDVAASINESRDLNNLLKNCMHTLADMVDARAAVLRLLTDHDRMELVASRGLDEDDLRNQQTLPAKICLLGKITAGSPYLLTQPVPYSELFGDGPRSNDQLSVITVPLQYREQTLGVYNLMVDHERVNARDDLVEILTSIGRHLGMAIANAQLDEEANRLSIMEERTKLAHELHDSLAQTLTSIRYQVRVLDETLHQGDEETTWHSLEQIENTLDQANTEVRELIKRFRAPIDERGLIPAVEETVARFKRESTIHIFLHNQWPQQRLPEEHELQVLRIVQEALNNVRKHSNANAVRVMLSGNEHGNYKILVEDDGIGFKQTRKSKSTRDHLGLGILEDLARRLNGKLHIESEPGEGTRLELSFHYPDPAGTQHQAKHNESASSSHR